jgi:hypothetical protein
MPRPLQIKLNKLWKLLSPSLIGFILIIFNLKRFPIAGKYAKSYIRRANIAGK